MKQKTAPTVFIHDNRMLAERAFYCLKTAGAVLITGVRLRFLLNFFRVGFQGNTSVDIAL